MGGAARAGLAGSAPWGRGRRAFSRGATGPPRRLWRTRGCGRPACLRASRKAGVELLWVQRLAVPWLWLSLCLRCLCSTAMVLH